MIALLKKIAIVDDDALCLKLLQAIVQELGYECVGTAQNGRDAVELVRRHQPQVLLLDIHMPIMDQVAMEMTQLESMPEFKEK